MPFSFGDVVLVPFPYSNQIGFKQRPAVVISSTEYNDTRPDVVVMAVTSQLGTQLSAGDLPILNWQSAQLLKPSAIKPVLLTIEQRLVRKSLGQLDRSDQAALRQTLARLLG